MVHSGSAARGPAMRQTLSAVPAPSLMRCANKIQIAASASVRKMVHVLNASRQANLADLSSTLLRAAVTVSVTLESSSAHQRKTSASSAAKRMMSARAMTIAAGTVAKRSSGRRKVNVLQSIKRYASLIEKVVNNTYLTY